MTVSQRDGGGLPPDLALLVESAQDPRCLALLAERHADLLARVEREGVRRYGDLGLDRMACSQGLARVGKLLVEAEGPLHPTAPPSATELLSTLLPAEIYLAEALVRGSSKAWTLFEELLETAWRTVSHHFRTTTHLELRQEIRESVLGTFFLEGKISTYRATAPLGAWARQVIFNIFRQRANQRKAGREPSLLSQLGAREADAEGLIPASREAAPPEKLVALEWSRALSRVVPEALETLDRDERRMMELLPTKKITQVELAQELSVSPFKLNRWYKDVRRRFMKAVTHRLRILIDLEDSEVDDVVNYLTALWIQRGLPEDRDFLQ